MSELLKLEGTVKVVAEKGIALAIVIAISLAVFYIGKITIKKLIKRYSKNKENPQVTTLLSVLLSVWKYFVLLIAVIAILNALGLAITATSLMAAAGAGGLVIGIGAQDFMKDILNGFTIIMESHFRVGDRVIINDKFGTVTNMTLRTTQIVGEKHEVFMIPNSAIGMVINYSKQNPRVFCYVYITSSKDVDAGLKVLSKVTSEHKSKYASGHAQLMGVTGMFPYGTQIGIYCDCEIGHMLDLQFSIYGAAALALSHAGICFTSDNAMMAVTYNE